MKKGKAMDAVEETGERADERPDEVEIVLARLARREGRLLAELEETRRIAREAAKLPPGMVMQMIAHGSNDDRSGRANPRFLVGLTREGREWRRQEPSDWITDLGKKYGVTIVTADVARLMVTVESIGDALLRSEMEVQRLRVILRERGFDVTIPRNGDPALFTDRATGDVADVA